MEGIKGFYESEQKEIESPFRKKKGGLQKLSLKVSAMKKREKDDPLNAQLQSILKTLEKKQQEFMSLQGKQKQEIVALYEKNDLTNLIKEWAGQFDFKTPTGTNQDEAA